MDYSLRNSDLDSTVGDGSVVISVAEIESCRKPQDDRLFYVMDN